MGLGQGQVAQLLVLVVQVEGNLSRWGTTLLLSPLYFRRWNLFRLLRATNLLGSNNRRISVFFCLIVTPFITGGSTLSPKLNPESQTHGLGRPNSRHPKPPGTLPLAAFPRQLPLSSKAASQSPLRPRPSEPSKSLIQQAN